MRPALGKCGIWWEDVLVVALSLVAFLVANAVGLAVTLACVGTVYRLLAEDHCAMLATLLDHGAWSSTHNATSIREHVHSNHLQAVIS